MMSVKRSAAIAAFAILAAVPAGVAAAQRPDPPQGAEPRREMLEQRLRERTAQIVQRRLDLTDDQMKQLQATNQRFGKQRGDLMVREREVRREIRQQILAGDDANENRVGQLLDQIMQLERQRLDLVQAEQRELARFLKPVQRAKLFALQNEMRRRAQELRGGPMQRRGVGPSGPRRFDQ